ncbi:MAG: hypothetical protein HFG30_08080 [Eubacterium sp.]|jgi:hypothetical protein|nr:hypothetical protein [Eubacterium sp.]
MKISITNKIRTACGNKLGVPLFLCAIMMIIFILCPFISVFHPDTVNDIHKVTSQDGYVKIKAKKLYYTGYNLEKSGGSLYGYYYSIKDGKSVFAIIPIEGVPQKVIKNYEFKARITKPNRAFKKMLESYMNDLNWNVDSFSKVNADFILSNADYYPSFYMVLLWIVLVIFLISMKKSVSRLIAIANPYIYPVCSFIGKKEQKALIDDAQYELDSENYIQINDMYITENYFIDLGKTKVSIIPLDEIVWCYRMGEISLNPKDTAPEFSICFMILTGSVITAKHKSSDEALELINAIRATGYEIIIGHSESKQKEAKRIVADYKEYELQKNN